MAENFFVLKEFLPLLAGTGGALSVARVLPRFGPGRAAWIALRSRFASKPNPESLRSVEVEILKGIFTDKGITQRYIVVTGEKGIGKTCLLRTATSKTPGVISVEAGPGESSNTIIKNTLKELTSPPFKFMDPVEKAPRVLFWFRLFTFGRSPIVVINATERSIGQEFAALTSAVRTLVDKYQLRVVVDGSRNSLDESILRTTRERVIHIKPMTREMIQQIGQLEDLFRYTKETGLNDVVFSVLGGIPSKYEQLWGNSKQALKNGENPRHVIGLYLCEHISDAVKIVRNAKSTAEDMTEIIKLFDKEKNLILFDSLAAKNLKRPSPDKVFRQVGRDGKYLVPASDAIGIVLRYSLSEEPSLEELEELLVREERCLQKVL